MSETRKYSFKTLGFELEFTGPASAADIARITGNPSACEEAFMLQYAYQDRNVEFREKFCAAVEAHTGEKRKQHTEINKKDGSEKVVYDETEQDFVNRMQAVVEVDGVKQPPKLSEEDASRLAHEVNNGIGDWAPSFGSDRKPAKPFYDLADGYLGKIAAGETTAERVAGNLERFLGVNFSSAYGDFNRDNLARALKALDEKKKREAKSELA